MEQLSLLDTDGGAKSSTYVFYCNDDWTLKTQGEEKLCMYYTDYFTKSELKALCNRAVKWHKRGQYGYSVYFEDDGVKKRICVRFTNHTASTKRTVFEHIDMYFDEKDNFFY